MPVNTTTAAATLQTYFKRRVEKPIVYKMVGLQLCVPEEIPTGKNNVQRFFKTRQLAPLADNFTLNEAVGTDDNGSVDQNLNIDYIERTALFFGSHISLNETIKNESAVNILDAVSQQITKQAGETINRRVYYELFLHASAIRADQDANFQSFNIAADDAVTATTVVFSVATTAANPVLATPGRADGAKLTFKSGANQGFTVTVNQGGHTIAGGKATLSWSNDNVLGVAPAVNDLVDVVSPAGLDPGNADDNFNLNAVLAAIEKLDANGQDPGVVGKMNKYFAGQLSNASEYSLLSASGVGTYQDLYKYTDVTDLKVAKAGMMFGAAFMKDNKPARSSNLGVRSDTGAVFSNFIVADQAMKAIKMWSGRRLDGVQIEISKSGVQTLTDKHKQGSAVAWHSRFVGGCVESRGAVNILSAEYSRD